MTGKKLTIIGACLILTVLLSLSLWMPTQPPEPVYQGKPLSYWMKGSGLTVLQLGSLGSAIAPEDLPGPDSALPALAAIGTNAIPRFLYWLKANDSAFSSFVHQIVARLTLQQWHHESALEKNLMAAHGLKLLGPLAKSALPDLMQIYGRPNEFSVPRFELMEVFGSIGPAAEPAVPLLVQTVTHDTNEFDRASAARALGQLQLRPEVSVPALIACLADPSADLRMAAVQSLGQFGRAAQPALPLLRKIADHADPPGIVDSSDSISRWRKDAHIYTLQHAAAAALKQIQSLGDGAAAPTFPK